MSKLSRDKPGEVLSGDSRIYLRKDAQFDSLTPSDTVETRDVVVRFEGVSPETLVSVLNALDGQKTIADIAKDQRVPVLSVKDICLQLVKHDVAVPANGASLIISAEEFARICNKLYPLWKDRVFSHPLWVNLSTGRATRSQFGGWLLEMYYFIETVNSRLAFAIAECLFFSARKHFIHHYTEEWDHHHFFMKGLRQFGFDEEAVVAGQPLPGTLAVANCMREAARRDPLYYAACSGFLESTGDDRAAGRRFFELLIAHYCPENPGVVIPMREHLDLDEAYGHNGVLEDMGPELGLLTSERVLGALRSVVELVETLELWATDIFKTYEHEDSLRPRNVRLYRAAPEGIVGERRRRPKS
jgi:TENA/THI-4/PQQC family protein